jgi:soluble lytic murein transglycosylase-like protein
MRFISHKLAGSCVIAIAGAMLACEPAAAQQASVATSTDTNSAATAVSDAAQRFGIPEQWIYAVMRAESAGRVNATSPAGAMGLMQIMPATWSALSARYGLGDDPYNVHANVMAGAAYIREMHDRYGAPGFLAAYNAGPGRYEAFLNGGRALPAETQNYAAKIAPNIDGSQRPAIISVALDPTSWTRASLFAPRSGSVPTDVMPTPTSRVSVASPPSLGGLFVALSGHSSQ